MAADSVTRYEYELFSGCIVTVKSEAVVSSQSFLLAAGPQHRPVAQTRRRRNP